MYAVFGIGNPLMDYLAHVEDSRVEALGARKGTMNLVDEETAERIVAGIPAPRLVPGGSCANTVRGLAWLSTVIGGASGRTALYSGAVGDDDVGRRYGEALRKRGVEPALAGKEGSSTGRSVVLVTPDGERTMFTCLGACRRFGRDDVRPGELERSRLLHIAGYMWDTESQKEAVRYAAEHARRRNIPVSFDLADPFVVQRYRDAFLRWIPGMVKVLFANEEELSLLVGTGESKETIRRAGELAPLVIMKRGAQGCMVNEAGEIHDVTGRSVEVVDTTGAGDAFAAGFLWARLRGLPVGSSAGVANLVASAIVEVEGCDFSAAREDLLSALADFRLSGR